MSFAAHEADYTSVRAEATPRIQIARPSTTAEAAPNCTPACTDAGGCHSSFFNDRDLSFLRFQSRIFDEARNESTPLLDRVKFLAIVATHLDDFVMVRGPEIRRNAARRIVVDSVLTRLTRDVAGYWRRQLVPALRSAGIHILDYRHLCPGERTEVDTYFSNVVRPQIAILPVEPGLPFPHIPALGMNLFVRGLNTADDEQLCMLRVADAVSALASLQVPAQSAGARDGHDRVRRYVWLDQVLIANLPSLFPQLNQLEGHRFRVLREMDVPDHKIDGDGPVERTVNMLTHREKNPVLTVTVDRRMPASMRDELACGLRVPNHVISRCGVVHDLRRLWEVNRIDRPDLKTPQLLPHPPASMKGHVDACAAARDRDVLLHHPYESFQPVVNMIQCAAGDPDVVSIAVTLYRTDRESPIAHALMEAARRGRDVRVVLELNARLDERRNVNWWRAFEEAGVRVFAAPPGLKVHTKMALIVRDEDGVRRRYAHLSSGNYNAFTAKVYTDLALLTCDQDIAADVEALFDALCGGSATARFRALVVAPLAMRQSLDALVEREIACQQRGARGHIIMKMNSLVDPDVIKLLYRASQRGVTVDLLVRGICCLRPGVSGLSDRIRVRSIVGRFLEHSRAWYFRNGGDHELYVGSADLIPRNLDQRVEVMAPLKDKALRQRVLAMLKQYLADDVRAHELQADGTYVRTTRTSDAPLLDAQLVLSREPIAAIERPDPNIDRPRVGGSGPHWAFSQLSAVQANGSAAD